MTESSLGIAVVNGEFSSIETAKISILDRGFLFGHSVFETILVKDGHIISWSEHYSRLSHGCKRISISLPAEETLKSQCLQAIQKNIELTKKTSHKSSLKIIVSGGNSLHLGIQKKDDLLPQSNTVLICRHVPNPSQKEYEVGVSLKSFCDFRSKFLLDIKSCDYLYNLISLEQAKALGYHDAIFLNQNNYFTECTTASFIWFDQNEVVYSAPNKDNCLIGTTLSTLVEKLGKNNTKFKWSALKKNNYYYKCAGCAMISSIRGILPVYKIDRIYFDVKAYSHFFKKLNSIMEQ